MSHYRKKNRYPAASDNSVLTFASDVVTWTPIIKLSLSHRIFDISTVYLEWIAVAVSELGKFISQQLRGVRPSFFLQGLDQLLYSRS